MKSVVIFLLCAILGTLSVIYLGQKGTFGLKSPSSQDSPSPQFSMNKPPSQSLVGKVTLISGDVAWQSRSTTDSAKLTNLIPIQQGEQLETKDTGSATVEFTDTAVIKLLPKTKINVAQTLPVNVVIVQQEGTAMYKKLGAPPISIRSHGLLVEIENGEALISLNNDQTKVTVTPTKGSLKAAFVDSQNETQNIDVTNGSTFTFDPETKQANVF